MIWLNPTKRLRASVTRFVKMCGTLAKSFGNPLGVYWNFEPSLTKVLCYWVNFNCCKWPNTFLNKESTHLVTLLRTTKVENIFSIFLFVTLRLKAAKLLKWYALSKINTMIRIHFSMSSKEILEFLPKKIHKNVLWIYIFR